MSNPTTVVVPRDISKATLASGSVPTTAGGTLFVSENPSRNGLLIRNNDGANSLTITPAAPGNAAPVTVPASGSIGGFSLANGASVYFGSGAGPIGVTTLFGGPTATCGFWGIGVGGAINVTVWEF